MNTSCLIGILPWVGPKMFAKSQKSLLGQDPVSCLDRCFYLPKAIPALKPFIFWQDIILMIAI